MATPQAPPGGTGNGREQVTGTIGGQHFTLAARDLVSILLLLGTFTLGFMVWQQFSFGLRLLHGQHRDIQAMMGEQNDLLRKQTEEMTNLFYALDANMGKPPEQRLPLRLYQQGHRTEPTLTPKQREDALRKEIEPR